MLTVLAINAIEFNICIVMLDYQVSMLVFVVDSSNWTDTNIDISVFKTHN